MTLLLAFLGAYANRVRGGFLGDLGWHKLVWPITFTLVALGTGIAPEKAFLAGILLWVGTSFRWGRYIGALGGWEKEELRGVGAIDVLISPAKSNMRLWGFLGTTLRGALLGVFPAVALGAPHVVLAGATMGLCYLAAIELCRKEAANPNLGWPIGEWIYGFVFFYIVFYPYIGA